MSLLLYLLLAFVGLLCYVHNRKEWYLVILYLVMSSCIGLLPYEGNKTYVVGLAMIVLPLIKDFRKIQIKNDKTGQALLLLTGWCLLRTVITLLIGEETSGYALRVVNLDLFFVGYFVFSIISAEEQAKSLKILFGLIVVACMIQLIDWGYHISAWQQRTDKSLVLYAMPSLAIFCFVWLFFQKRFNLLFFIIGVSLLLTNARGLLIAFALSLGYFIVRTKRLTSILGYAVVCVVVALVFSQINQKKAISDEFEQVERSNFTHGDNSAAGKGTLMFRLLLAQERWDYMTEDPMRALFGIGTIHELSPNNKLNFELGSWAYDPQKKQDYRQQINTTDVGLVTHFMRYGLVYVGLFVWFSFCAFKRLNVVKDSYTRAAACTFLIYWIGMVSSDRFSLFEYMFPILLILTMFGTTRNDDSTSNVERYDTNNR